MASISKGEGSRVVKEKKIIEETEGDPVCENCGNAKLKENEEWVCPHCQGEIDFLGGDDE
jgi:Zn finger protein HypA/HybF involved in hydrogenase expression